ncbi:MAG: uroporphyrinogen-III C-methyltransferase [Panacagrimonas sp.]
MSDPAPSDLATSALSPSATPATSGPRRRRRLRFLLPLLFLLALAAAGLFGWQWWTEHGQLEDRIAGQDQSLKRLDAQIAVLDARSGEVLTRQSDLSRLADRNGTDIAAVQARIEDSLKLMSRISEDLSGGRTRFQLAAVEHLLVMANDRLLLQHDVTAALAALDSADQRLAEQSDPLLFPVREALAQERAALRAVPAVDLVSAALTLASLIERVPQLPLASHAPAQFETPTSRENPGAADVPADGWRRLVAAVQTAATRLFTIRREDNARAMRLLPPEAEATVYHVLALRVEGARVALLRGETVALRESLRSAAAWLDTEFKPDDPGVLATRAELERLQGLNLRPPLPDISRSLAALRSRLDATRQTP